MGLRGELGDAGVTVVRGDEHVGSITRTVDSPTLDRPIALATVGWNVEGPLSARIDGGDHEATLTDLPFVEGSGRSARLPDY